MNTTHKNNQVNTKIKGHVLYVTHSRYDYDWHSVPHSHSFLELFYVIAGSGKFLLNDEYVDIKADDLIIVNPNTVHTETSKGEQALEYIVLGIEGVNFLDNQNVKIYNYHEYKHEVLFYIKTLMLEMKNQDQYSQDAIQSLLEILFINMIRRTNDELQFINLTSKKASKECAFVERYINEHFKENITLDDLAELTFLNKYYLVHSFKKYKGQSPIDYMIARRIDEAKMLLETTDLSINDVASSVGYANQSYFSQAFLKHNGKSPKQYRKDFSQNK